MDTLENAIRLSSGLVRELYDHAMEVGLPYRPFALAASLSLIATCGQRRYLFQELKDISLFVIIVGDSADGKSFFQKDYVGRYMREIDAAYMLKNVASLASLKLSLAECPSRLFVIDEMAKKWGRVYRSNPCERQQEILTAIMEVYGCPDLLEGQEKGTTSAKLEDVESPRMTVLGGTTNGGLAAMFSNDLFLYDGMASRLVYLPSEGFQKIQGEVDYEWKPKPHIVEKLVGLVRVKPNCMEDVQNPGFRAQRTGIRIGFASPAVRAAWLRVRDAYEDKALAASKIDGTMAQYYRRGHERALKYAYIHCLGDGRQALIERDMAFGRALLEHEIGVVIKMVNHGKPLLCEEAVMDYMRENPDKPIAGWQVQKNVRGGRKWTCAEVNSSLAALAKAGSIAVEEGGGRRGPVGVKYCYYSEQFVTPRRDEAPVIHLQNSLGHDKLCN